MTYEGSCIGSGDWSPSCHCGGSGSIPGQSTLDLGWTTWQWFRFFSQYFGCTLSASFHKYSLFIYRPITGYIILAVTVSLNNTHHHDRWYFRKTLNAASQKELLVTVIMANCINGWYSFTDILLIGCKKSRHVRTVAVGTYFPGRWPIDYHFEAVWRSRVCCRSKGILKEAD